MGGLNREHVMYVGLLISYMTLGIILPCPVYEIMHFSLLIGAFFRILIIYILRYNQIQVPLIINISVWSIFAAFVVDVLIILYRVLMNVSILNNRFGYMQLLNVGWIIIVMINGSRSIQD